VNKGKGQRTRNKEQRTKNKEQKDPLRSSLNALSNALLLLTALAGEMEKARWLAGFLFDYLKYGRLE